MKKRAVLLGAVAMMTASGPFAQGIYKWVDAQGQVHYGERPPDGGPAAEVTVRTAPPPPAATQTDRLETTRRLLSNFDEERAKKAEQEAKASEAASKRDRMCHEARDRQRRYQEAGRIYKLDANGERVYMDDAEHSAALNRAQQEVDKYCD